MKSPHTSLHHPLLSRFWRIQSVSRPKHNTSARLELLIVIVDRFPDSISLSFSLAPHHIPIYWDKVIYFRLCRLFASYCTSSSIHRGIYLHICPFLHIYLMKFGLFSPFQATFCQIHCSTSHIFHLIASFHQ